jgi:hypothetical protein
MQPALRVVLHGVGYAGNEVFRHGRSHC